MADEKQPIPTLYEWAGGMEAFIKLFDQFYDKVLADDILDPVNAGWNYYSKPPTSWSSLPIRNSVQHFWPIWSREQGLL